MRGRHGQRRGGPDRARPAAPTRARRGLLAAGGLAPAVVSLAVAAAVAAPSRPVSIADTTDDTSGPLDIKRVQLSRVKDGRLRARVTFVAKITPKTLLAPGGPPGSACLRIWTVPDADPPAIRPDRLVCVSARSDDEIRGGVYQQIGSGLPKRVADAAAKLTPSGRSLIVRISQSALGRPRLIRFAAESTRPGCERVSCVDIAPNNGKTRRFRLR
jgi:hypothetical protein